jgi:DNA polymerase I-like protein with 3'-5' exonuclease and polymerase domains/intein/homing endonuclease
MEPSDYFVINTAEELRREMENLSQHAAVGFDCETTSLDPYGGRLRLVQLAAPDGVRIIDLDRFAAPGEAARAEALEPLRRLLAAPRPVKVAHNAKFDAKWTRHQLGVELGGVFDTLLASQLVSAGETEDRHSLAAVAERYLDETIDKAEQLSDWGGELSAAQLEYAARDAAVMLPLREALIGRLRTSDLVRCASLEFECVLPVSTIELTGIFLDAARWREQLAIVEKRRAILAEELQAMLAEESPQQSFFGPTRLDINLDSHVQLTKALNRRGIEVPDGTRNWKLQPLAEKHEEIRTLLEYRTVQKALTSYGENILNEINPATGRIHANFHQIGAPTGRMACLAGDTLVFTAAAGFKRMKDIREGDEVKTSYGFKRVQKAWMNGVRQLYRIRLRDGRTIRATADHRFLAGRAETWKRLDELRPGDAIYVSLKVPEARRVEEERRRIEVFAPEVRSRKPVTLPTMLSAELCELMGLIIADGFLGRRHERPVVRGRERGTPATYDRVCIAFNRQDCDLIERVVSYGRKLFDQPFVSVKSKSCQVLQLASTRAAEFLAALGLTGSAHTKAVPEIVMRAPSIYQAAFMRGLFEGDGHRMRNSVGLTSVNQHLLRQVQLMLTNFGIYSTIKQRTDTSGFAGSVRFDLKIHKKSCLARFSEQIGFLSQRKDVPFVPVTETTDGVPTPFIIPGARLYREAVAAGVTQASRTGLKPFAQYYKGWRIKEESVKKLITRFGMLPSLQPVSDYLNLELRPVTIESVTPDGVEEVYDITVEDVHEFVADGIVVHNCTSPNIQQVPHAVEYRRCFRAPEGRKLVISDYCVAQGTRVATTRGLITVEDVQPGDEVYLEDGSSARVSARISRGRLPAVTVTLKNGYSLTATTLHRIRVLDEEGRYVWRRIGELRKTDFVAIQPGRGLHDALPYVELPEATSEHRNNHKTLSTPRHADERLAAFMGYISGDGSLRKNVIQWVVNDQDREVFEMLGRVADELFRIPVHDRGAYRGVLEAGLYSVPLVRWCLAAGMSKSQVPEFLWRSRRSVVAAYLRGLFEADGSVTDCDTGKVSFASSRRQLAFEVHQLLLALGIPATLREQRNTGPDKKFSCWMVAVLAAGLQSFSGQVGFISERKRRKLHALVSRQTGKTVVGNMPNLQGSIRALHLSGEARRLLNNSSSLGRPVSTALALTLEENYPEVAHSLPLHHITSFRQLFLQVAKIESAGAREVFDLSVPGPMTYLSDGFVSHNSQIELRILADYTGDQGFIDAFQSGADLHRVTAAQVFGVPLEGVTKEQRDFAKRLNFGVVYGIGAQRFSMMTGLSLTDAEDILRRYFATYRALDRWLREAAQMAVRERMAPRTVAGRLARFNFDPEDRQAVSLAQRNGKNSPIQGSSADILKRALRLLHDRLKDGTARIVNIVHDEIVVEADSAEAEEVAKAVEEAMCAAGEEFVKKVPVKVESQVADEWVK